MISVSMAPREVVTDISLQMDSSEPVFKPSNPLSSLVSLEDAVRSIRFVERTIVPIRDYKDEDMDGEEKKNASDNVEEKLEVERLTISVNTDVSLLEIPPPPPVEQQGKPPLPPLPRKLFPLPQLRRHQSAPSLNRRAIFSPYWRAKEETVVMRPATPKAPPSALRKRSASVSDLPTTSHAPEMSCIDFTPPVGSASLLATRRYFKRVEEVPQIHLDLALPSLPSPLQRYGKRKQLGGAYPLCKPQPILRQSSYTGSEHGTTLGPSTLSSLATNESEFNLTKTIRILPATSSHDTDMANSARGSGSRTHCVAFDPRVTVTEFEDYAPRQWFSDMDLERFRVETVLVAQKYLAQHPEMIELYNKPRLDPVTGTLRKKALYSMPALGAEDVDSLPDTEKHRRLMEALAVREVKNILLVDRNKVILDLFRRSLKTIFPHAQITTTESAEEALKVFRQALGTQNSFHRMSFDIVIAEEHLHEPLTVANTPLVKGGKSMTNLPGLSASDVRDEAALARHGSLIDLSEPNESQGCSGSEFLRRICSLTRCSDVDEQSIEASTLRDPVKGTALLIGVSALPGVDVVRLTDSGADFVWGKPPPRMNDELRNQLVSRLVNKRRVRTSTASCS